MRKINPKIIDQRRYNKTTKSKSKKNKLLELEKKNKQKDIKKNLENIKIKNSKTSNVSYIKLNSLSEDINVKSKTRTKRKNDKKYNMFDEESTSFKILKLSLLGILLLVIGVTSKKLIDIKNSPKNVLYTDNDTGITVSLMQDYDLNIGISKLDTLDLMKTRNVVLNELYKISNLSLVKIDTNYNIEYNIATSITKVSNREYEVIIDNKQGVSVEDIQNTINKINEIGSQNIYYNYIQNIDSIKKASNECMYIYLKNDDPYFVYKLDFPIITASDNVPYKISNNDNNIELLRNKSESTLKSITLNSFSDSDTMVEKFVNNEIDVFTASSDSIMTLVGKHDYNIKKYRDGNTIFILPNVNSELFSKKEVRQAFLYSLNRDEILNDTLGNTFYELIDIPFIYSDIKYKYDTYGVQNILSSQGWAKRSGIYTKNIDGKNYNLILTLLVNSSDTVKVKIADSIKQMAEASGIKVNLKSLSGDDLNYAIQNKEYDIVLADVTINQVPDLGFIEEYLQVNDIVKSSLNILKESDIDSIPKNIEKLKETLSSEIACIGIAARNVNVIYQSYITGFKNLNYMHIYDNLKYIGKIQDINK